MSILPRSNFHSLSFFDPFETDDPYDFSAYQSHLPCHDNSSNCSSDTQNFLVSPKRIAPDSPDSESELSSRKRHASQKERTHDSITSNPNEIEQSIHSGEEPMGVFMRLSAEENPSNLNNPNHSSDLFTLPPFISSLNQQESSTSSSSSSYDLDNTHNQTHIFIHNESFTSASDDQNFPTFKKRTTPDLSESELEQRSPKRYGSQKERTNDSITSNSNEIEQSIHDVEETMGGGMKLIAKENSFNHYDINHNAGALTLPVHLLSSTQAGTINDYNTTFFKSNFFSTSPILIQEESPASSSELPVIDASKKKTLTNIQNRVKALYYIFHYLRNEAETGKKKDLQLFEFKKAKNQFTFCIDKTKDGEIHKNTTNSKIESKENALFRFWCVSKIFHPITSKNIKNSDFRERTITLPSSICNDETFKKLIELKVAKDIFAYFERFLYNDSNFVLN